MRISSLLLALGVVMTGCVADDADDEGAGEWGDIGGDGKADDTTPAAPGTLSSKYALELTSTMKLEDTRDGSRSDFKLRARGTVTTVQDGENLELEVKLCDVALPEVSGYQPLLDPAFVARLAPLKIKGTIHDDNGFRLATEPVALVLGAQLANPLSNRLPATADDTRVKDQDQDGNPGVSIQIPGYGKIFGTMRVKVSIAATVAGAPSISGTSDIVLDQVVYGDDIWFYDAATSIAESQAATRTISSANTFRMKSGVTGCTGVRQAFP